MNIIKMMLLIYILRINSFTQEKIIFYAVDCDWGGKCPSIEYETIFNRNFFTVNFSVKIDSLFYAITTEINKLPTHGWIDDENYEWLEPELKNCWQITIPKSLFFLLDNTEQDSLYSIVKRNVIEKKSSSLNTVEATSNIYYINTSLNITDSIASGYYHYYASISACSIRADIKQDPSGEYILSLNNTLYRMVKLSDNHYVLRKEEKE